MNAEKTISNQRDSYRCPVAESRRACEMKIGDVVVPAILLDESAGGFSVLVDRSLELSIDQVVFLHTDTGWFEVRIVHIATMASSDEGETPETEDEMRCFRLGLLRLGEVGTPDPPKVSRFGGSLLGKCWPLIDAAGRPDSGNIAPDSRGMWWPINRQSTFFGILLAVVAVTTPVVILGSMKDTGQWNSTNIPHWKDYISGWIAPYEPERGPEGFDRTEPSPRSSSSSSLSSDQDFQVKPDVSNLIRRLHSPTILTMPEVVLKLRLTDAQQENIRGIIQSASNLMCELDANSRSLHRRQIEQMRKKLLDDALHEALQTLDQRQIAQWQKIVAKNQPKPEMPEKN